MRFGGALVLVLASACGVFGSADTPEEPTPIVDGKPLVGVFASVSKGADDGDGSRGRPLKTLRAASARARDLGQGVIACAETFAEKVELVDGVSMYGGYDCVEWTKTDRRTEIASPEEIAMVARGIARTTNVEAFAIKTANASANDDVRRRTSIGVHVIDSKNIVFTNVVVTAGAGLDGVDGAAGENNVELSATHGGRAGFSQTQTCPYSGMQILLCSTLQTIAGSPGGTSQCKVGPAGYAGGNGGDGAHEPDPAWSTPSEDFRGRPFVGTATTAQGGIGKPLNTAGAGGPGSPGTYGAHGTDGAHGVGKLDAQGFLPGDGSKGFPGGPGQGGGGGGGNGYWRNPSGLQESPSPGTNIWCATGAGGGAGGCGGLAGEPGRGGGASIGMLVVQSSIRLVRSTIESGRGGRAGRGHLGHQGLAGGAPGTASDWGGAGGRGGDGGASGLSGHGSPGPSIAIVYAGERPDQIDVKLVSGPGGEGAPELRKGVLGGVKVLPAVADGESKTEHAIVQ